MGGLSHSRLRQEDRSSRFQPAAGLQVKSRNEQTLCPLEELEDPNRCKAGEHIATRIGTRQLHGDGARLAEVFFASSVGCHILPSNAMISVRKQEVFYEGAAISWGGCIGGRHSGLWTNMWITDKA